MVQGPHLGSPPLHPHCYTISREQLKFELEELIQLYLVIITMGYYLKNMFHSIWWIVYNFTRFYIKYNLIWHSIWFNNGALLSNKIGNYTASPPHRASWHSASNYFLKFSLNLHTYILCAICMPYWCPYACLLYLCTPCILYHSYRYLVCTLYGCTPCIGMCM
jgi:hypothetical protein